MKKIIFGLALLLFFSVGYSQDPDIKTFFKELEKSNDYAVVKVNKEMFQLLAAMDTELENGEVQELIDGLNEITVLINEEGSETDYNKFQSMVTSKKLTSYMSFKEEGKNVNLYSQGTTSDGKLKGIVLSVKDGKQNIFINVDGLISLSALGKLTKDIHIDGFDQLKDLEKHKK